MPKITPSENTFIDLIRNAGGSYCTTADQPITSEVRRMTNRLERKGVLMIEPTQDGTRFTLRETVHG